MATAEKRNFQNYVLDLIPSCYLPKNMTRIANSTNIGMKISCMLPTPCLSWAQRMTIAHAAMSFNFVHYYQELGTSHSRHNNRNWDQICPGTLHLYLVQSLEFYQLVVQGTAKISVKITKLYRILLIQSFKLKVCSNSRVTKETTEKKS